MKRLPPLNPLLAFETAARHLSFTKAAAELNITQGAVSRRVASLESFFGERLFERHAGGITLTSRGADYAVKVNRSFDGLRSASREYAMATTRATLTIKGYPLLLNSWLMPMLPDFADKSPNVDVRLVGSSGASHVDFSVDEVDLGIRYGRGKWRGLKTTLLFRDELYPVCSPGLVKIEKLNKPADLIGSSLLQTYARDHDWSDWCRLSDIDEADALKHVRSFEDLSLVHQFALEGSGIAILQRAYIEADLKSGRLVIPFKPVLRRDLGYYLVCPAERANVPEVKSFSEWLANRLTI